MSEREVRGPDTELRRSIGLTEAVLITIGAIIGSGIFVALGPAAASAGSGLLLAIVLAGFVALMNGISSSQLGINYPVSGGTYAFAREVGLKTMGFVAGAAFLGKEVVGLSVIALTFATYSAQIVSGLPISLTAALTLLAVTALNYFGLELTTRVLIGLTIGKVLLLIAFVVLATPSGEPSQLAPLLGTGPLGVLSGAAVFFAFAATRASPPSPPRWSGRSATSRSASWLASLSPRRSSSPSAPAPSWRWAPKAPDPRKRLSSPPPRRPSGRSAAGSCSQQPGWRPSASWSAAC